MRDFKAEDRAQRAKLERQSSAGQRADIVGSLNKIAAGDARRELPGVLAYRALMAAQGGHARDVARLNKRHDLLMRTGRLDRIHPDSLARAAAERPRVSAAEEDDARDSLYVTPLKAGRVPDADGSMVADAGTRAGHWDDQGVHPRTFTIEEMAALAAAQVRASRYF